MNELRWPAKSALLVVALLVVACGDDDGAPADGGVGDAGSDSAAPLAIAPPEAAAAPNAPCPAEWQTTLTPTRAELCAPWSGAGPDCPEGAHRFPGDAACTVEVDACPAGEYPEGLPAGATIYYVNAAAPAGGDGTIDTPFSTIRDALRVATSGHIVAVAAGTYDEEIAPRAGVTLWGACAARTRIASSTPSETFGSVILQAADIVVKHVSVGGARAGFAIGGLGPRARVEDVVVEDATGAGMLFLDGAIATLDRVVVRRVVPFPSGRFGYGLIVGRGSSVTATKLLVDGTVASGTHVFMGSSIVLSDAAIRSVAHNAMGQGHGLSVQEASTAMLERVLVESTVEAGISILGEGSNVVANDLLVRAVDAEPFDGNGRGVNVQTGGRFEAHRAWIADVRDIGVYASGAASVLDLSEVVIAGLAGRGTDQNGGNALRVEIGAQGTVRRALFAEAREAGASATAMGALDLEDVTIRDVEGNAGDMKFGFGVVAQTGGTVTGRRVHIERARTGGIGISGIGTTASFEDLTMRDVREELASSAYGIGAAVSFDARLVVTRGLVERARTTGFLAQGAGARIELTDVSVRDTETPSDGRFGVGLASVDHAALVATRFESSDHALAGITVAREAEMDLHEGLVARNPVGANIIAAPGFDVARLQDRVAYVDNETTLSSANELPVPDVSALPVAE